MQRCGKRKNKNRYGTVGCGTTVPYFTVHLILHTLQRESIRGLSIYPKPSQYTRCPLAAAANEYLSKRLLQLPETSEVWLLCRKTKGVKSDSEHLS
jgi:hypothetical protein